jgi:Fur family peroxide stress response transcriptional regulator
MQTSVEAGVRFERLRDRAKSQGLRITPQREVLLRILALASHHPTADELYKRVLKRMPSVSPATVYRNVQTLVHFGVISVLDRAGGATRYDPNPEQHHHFVCNHCRKLFDVYLSTLEYGVNAERSPLDGARILGCQVQLQGVCSQCLAVQ